MPTEIFTLIQPQLSNNQAQLNNSHVQESQSQPGLFAQFESLLNGLTINKDELINPEIMQSEQVIQQKISFKNNDSFSQDIINKKRVRN